MLDMLDVKVGYFSAACGMDIRFAERMLERNAELHSMIVQRSVYYGLEIRN